MSTKERVMQRLAEEVARSTTLRPTMSSDDRLFGEDAAFAHDYEPTGRVPVQLRVRARFPDMAAALRNRRQDPEGEQRNAQNLLFPAIRGIRGRRGQARYADAANHRLLLLGPAVAMGEDGDQAQGARRVEGAAGGARLFPDPRARLSMPGAGAPQHDDVVAAALRGQAAGALQAESSDTSTSDD